MTNWKNNQSIYNEGREINVSMNPPKENKSYIDSNKKEKKSILEKYFGFLNNNVNPNKEIDKTDNDINNNLNHSNESDCKGTNESIFYEIKSSREFIKGSLLNFGSYSENIVSSKMSFYSIYEYTDDNEDSDCKIEDNEQENATILMKNESYSSLPNKEILPEYKDNNDYMHIYDTDNIYSDGKSDDNASDDNINDDKTNEESITKEMAEPPKIPNNIVEEKKKHKWLQKKLLKKKYNLICRHKIKNKISKFQYLGIISILNKKYTYIVVNKKIIFTNKPNNKNETFFKGKPINKNSTKNYNLFCDFSKKKIYNVLKKYKINRQHFFTYLHFSMLKKYYKKKIITCKGVDKTILNESKSVTDPKNEQHNEIDTYNNNADVLCTSHPSIQNEIKTPEKSPPILENTIAKIINEECDDKNSPKNLLENNNKDGNKKSKKKKKKKKAKKNCNVASGKVNIYFEAPKKISDNENINDTSKQEVKNKKKRKNRKKKNKKNKQNQNSNNKQIIESPILDNKEQYNHELSNNSNDLKCSINYDQEEKTIDNNSKGSYFSQQNIILPSNDENATDSIKNIYSYEKINSNISLDMDNINKCNISHDGYPTSDEDMDIFMSNDMFDSKNDNYKVKNNNQDNNIIGITNEKYSDNKYSIDGYANSSYEHYNKNNLETNKNSNLVIYSEVHKNNENFGKSFEHVLKKDSNLVQKINSESYQSLYNYKNIKHRKVVNSEEDIENNLEKEIKRTIEELFKAFPGQFFLDDFYEEPSQKTTIQSENIVIKENDQNNQIMHKICESIEITPIIENPPIGHNVQNEMNTESQICIKFIEKDDQHIINKTKNKDKVCVKKIQKDNKRKLHMKGKFLLNVKAWKNNKKNDYTLNCEDIEESYKNENEDTKKAEENPISINNENLSSNEMSQSEDSQKNEDMEIEEILLSSTHNDQNLDNQTPKKKENGVMFDINMEECKKEDEDIVENLPITLAEEENVDPVICNNGIDANNDEKEDNKTHNYHHMITQMNENNMSRNNSEETIRQYSDAWNIDEIHKELGQENKINTLEKKCQIEEDNTEKNKIIQFYNHAEVSEVEKLEKNHTIEENIIVKKLKKKKKNKKKSKGLQIYKNSVFDKYIIPLIIYMNVKRQQNEDHNNILAKLIEYYIAYILNFGKLHQYITPIYDNQHFINTLYIMNKKLIWVFYLKVIVTIKKKETKLNKKKKTSIGLIDDYKMEVKQIENENLQICQEAKINKQIYPQNDIVPKIDISNSVPDQTPYVDNTSNTYHEPIPHKEGENINLLPNTNSNQNNIKQSLKNNVSDYNETSNNSIMNFISYNNIIKNETTNTNISINLIDANKILTKQNQYAINTNYATNGNLFDVKDNMNNHIKICNTSQNHNIYDYTYIDNINILSTPLYIHDSCNANIKILNTHDMNRIDLQNMKCKKNMLMHNNKTMIQHSQSNEGTYNHKKNNIIKMNASKLIYSHGNKPYNTEMCQNEQINKNMKIVVKKNYLNRKDVKNYINKALTSDSKLAEQIKIKNDLPVSTNTTKINKSIPKISLFKRIFYSCSFFNNIVNDTKKIKYHKNGENNKIQNKMNVKNTYTRNTIINMNKYNLKVKKIVFHKKRKINKMNKIIQQTNKYLELFNSQSLSLFNALCNNNYFNCLPLKNKNIESFHISFLDSLPNNYKSRVSYMQNTENICIYKDF